MAKYYGDIPCVKLDGVIHITKNGTECLCGAKWQYGYVNKDKYSIIRVALFLYNSFIVRFIIS